MAVKKTATKSREFAESIIDTVREPFNAHGHKLLPVWKDASFWHITILMAVFSVFYYMDVIIDFAGWTNLRWGIFYTVHDLHRALFLIPVMYAAYALRLKGALVTSIVSFLIFLPRALFVSPYPNPLLRAVIFAVSMIIMGVFLSLLLENINKRKELAQSLGQAQNELLRKKAEAESATAQRLYRELFDNVAIGILRTTPGPEGTFIDANPALIQMFEADSREQMMTLHPSDIYWDLDQRRIVSDAIVANGFVKEEIKFKSLKGNPFWGQIHSIRKSDINGNTYFDSTVENITERKRMEERLQESEKLYRSLFDSMLNAFQYSKMIFDQGTPVDYIYLDVNGVFESLTGLKDVIGRKVSEVLPGILQSDPELFHILARVALSGNHEKFDINVKALNKWFSASAYSPAKEYFVVIFEDINERKLAEETLRERELILRTMFDQSYQLMAMSTPDGRFLRVNATALDLVGVREEDVLGKYLWDTPWWSHSEDEQNKIKDGLRRAAAGETVRYVTTHYDTSGNPHYIDISLKPVMDENGVVTMILPEGRDITERKRVDEELRKLNEELEQRVANRTAELTAKTNQLERINKTFVDRELRMRELKERIAELEKNVKSEK